MSLTKDDLQAIKQIVEASAEDVKLQTAAGFKEVHERIDGVEDRLSGVEGRLGKLEEEVSELNDRTGRIENTGMR